MYVSRPTRVKNARGWRCAREIAAAYMNVLRAPIAGGISYIGTREMSAKSGGIVSGRVTGIYADVYKEINVAR